MSENTHEEEIKAFFNDIDVNGSGSLEVVELKRLFGQNAETVAAELDGIGNGGNGDGVVSLDELQSFFNNIKANTETAGKDGEAAVKKALKGLRVTLEKAPKEEAPPALVVEPEAPKEEAPVEEEKPVEEEAPFAEEPKVEEAPKEEAPVEEAPKAEEEEVVDIPDNEETNKAAQGLQNLKRKKDAKAKVAAKRAELAALDEAEKKIEEEAAAAGVTDQTTEAELEEMASGPEADKAATMLQSMQRKKDAIKRVEAKKAELAAAKEEEEAIDIPDNEETNKAAQGLQNLKRKKDAKAKVAAKRAELAALDEAEKKIEEEAAAAGVTDQTTEAELEEMASGPEADKAATMLQSMQRKKDAIKKVDAKRAELKAAEDEVVAVEESPNEEAPAGLESAVSPRAQIAAAKELDSKLNPPAEGAGGEAVVEAPPAE
ncbi:hypothetical protein TL16_g03142 [Triparma laevis f. inornata]|uniref:EF-hand domain-containing protein n=1 Tax=Triparma laevis f. inornata TaxID=1714386 RepID=A0A9W7A1B3_9STRA|nr:hypothetical protein TL16_g03142 [Triparma laevis f. inornata]